MTTPTNGGSPASPRSSAAVVLSLLCSALEDLMGGAATACLLRRAIKRSAVRCPELAEIAIIRDRFAYRYQVPESWGHEGAEADQALGELLHELRPLLLELTGQVVLIRLHAIPELAQRGHFGPEV